MTRPLLLLCLCAVICSLAASLAHAQPSKTITVPESIKLSRLVDLTSEASGHQYSYLPTDLEAAIILRVSKPLTGLQLQDLLHQVLAARGFAVVRTPGSAVLSVVKLEAAAALATLSGQSTGAGFITEVVTAKNQPAKVIADNIKSLLSKPGGAATVLGDGPMIVLSDFSNRIDEIKPLIAKLDIPDAVITRQVPAKSMGATQLVAVTLQAAGKREAAKGHKLAGDLIATPDAGSVLLITTPQDEAQWLELLSQLDQREAVQTLTYMPRSFAAKDVSKLFESVANPAGTTAADDRFRLVVDDLTGSLIVTATATQHDRIRTLLERLDSTEHTPMPVKSFPIRNRPVSEVLRTLQTLIEAGVLDAGSIDDPSRSNVTAGSSQTSLRPPLLPQTGGSAPVPATTDSSSAVNRARISSAEKRPISLTADEPTNTLIAIAEPRMLSQLETLLLTLDVRQPQVMLEVKLVSLTDSETLTLGAELERIGSIDNATVRLASLFGLSTGGPAGRVVGDAAGFTGAVLNPGEFSIIVRALETVNQGRSVSNPKVLVSNNERAVFSSTLQQPIQQQTRTGSNDTFLSYGGTENAGTTISVKPQIAQGDHLVLTYSIKLSSFVGTSASVGLPPPKQENAVDSVATIPDGYTVVVGGLDLITNGKGESRIPLIGEVPLIGELFKTRNNSDSHTRFFVFIRANVMRNSSFDDLKYMSGADMSQAQVDDGFPEVAPRVIR